ncbi:MAG TPA: hypothetical protein VET65_04580, partial [Candidatus Limnocylindrales bacterium]|nr:hypothetical protein [Candidatus Limnocylindrales bacterium]
IFPGSPSPGGFRGAADADLALISYLNESFPQLSLAGPRRERVRRRMKRALGLPPPPQAVRFGRLEEEMNRRLRSVDPRWRPVMGGAAILLLGVLGIAFMRQRSGPKGIAAILP